MKIKRWEFRYGHRNTTVFLCFHIISDFAGCRNINGEQFCWSSFLQHYNDNKNITFDTSFL